MKHSDYRPNILGLDWAPGNLILVGSRAWGGRLQYVLGNCIVNGTKDEIPVAIFIPGRDRGELKKLLLRMQVGDSVYESGQITPKDLIDYPLYIDDTAPMTIAYLTGQIFRYVEEKNVGMVVIDLLQNIDGGIIDESTREGELNGILCILKALAETLGIVIVVISQLSRIIVKEHRMPKVRDLLDVTEAEEHCDQIILIHPLDPFVKEAMMILPFGSPNQYGRSEEQILSVSMDCNKHYFRKI